jgi:ferrous iron transport protein B
MTALFSSIYWLAAPLMDIVDGFFGWSIEVLHQRWGSGLFINFLADGILAGAGAVLIFVPQILILFLGISFLEDSGYLARAATLIDRPLSKVGLNGKAFVPLLSGFACAVPAIMAARAIGSHKERWLATFIIPFMTCSARLPVYALLVGFLFPNDALRAGLLMTGLYVAAIVVGFVAAGVLNLLLRKQSSGFLILELPLYRWPQPIVVIRNSFRRTRAYVEKTAPIILVLAVALWLLTTFPQYQLDNESEWLEPVFEPMGGDWRVGVGLVTAFAAREVFVSSMAVLFSITDVEDEDSLREGLLISMRKATFPDGRLVFTTASVSALLVFFMLALQCISTSAVAFREMGSASFAVAQLISMNLLAYAAAIITYSVMS